MTTVSRRELLFGALALGASPTLARLSPDEPQDDASAPRPVFRRTAIGDFEVFSLQDLTIVLPVDQAPFVPSVDREEVSRALAAQGLRTGSVGLEINVLAFRKGTEVTLIDAGLGPQAGAQAVPALAAAGIDTKDVKAVLVTHAHPDHIGGLLKLDGTPAFPEAEVFFPEPEHRFWSTQPSETNVADEAESDRRVRARDVQRTLKALGERVRVVEPGKVVRPGFVFEGAFGHTPGHCLVRAESNGEQVLHVADTLHHAFLMTERPDWCYTFDADPVAAVATRKFVLDMAVADGLRLFGTHTPFPGFGRVERAGQSFRYRIEPWVY